MPEEKQSLLRNDEEIRLAYQEVCNSFHAIADFRAKLLGLLPLVSGVGIFILLNQGFTSSTARYLLPIGIFGFIVTLGLSFYELRGIQKCNSLVKGGQNIEALFGIYGQFRLLPSPINGFIRNTLAARIIYPAVLAAWVFVALVNFSGLWSSILALLIFFITFAASSLLNLKGEVKEELDKSSVLGKMLNLIDPNLLVDAKTTVSVKELKECLEKLSLQNRAPTQREWQKLFELTKIGEIKEDKHV